MRFFEKFSKERYTPLYPFQKGIKGYNVFSLPVSFQDFTFEIQRALFRCFDRMKLPAFCKRCMANARARYSTSVMQRYTFFPSSQVSPMSWALK